MVKGIRQRSRALRLGAAERSAPTSPSVFRMPGEANEKLLEHLKGIGCLGGK